MAEDVGRVAAEVDSLFSGIYLAFHRRDGKRSGLTGASRAVLMHLSASGPLTVGEAARHLGRAQSVVSDTVTQLEAKGLLARQPDPGDRRRTLVWLTADGMTVLQEDSRVLSTELLSAALSELVPDEQASLLTGMRALLAARPPPSDYARPPSPRPPLRKGELT